jgi:hypothetical protein
MARKWRGVRPSAKIIPLHVVSDNKTGNKKTHPLEDWNTPGFAEGWKRGFENAFEVVEKQSPGYMLGWDAGFGAAIQLALKTMKKC